MRHTFLVCVGSAMVILFLVPLMQASAASSQDTKTDIPLKRVVLYFSGLAFYEHRGMVEGDTVIKLTFKTEQMNDVLKSLILRDFGGGTIQTVSYPAQEPIQRSLQSFAIDLSSNPSMAALLNQVIGHELLVASPDIIQGRLVSLERRPRETRNAAGTTVIEDTWLNLLTKDGLQSVALGQVSSLKLSDFRMQNELDAALRLLQSSSDDERRTIEIICKGSGKREISFGYVQEAPVWKTSYRLELSKGKPWLQAWAIVENTSENDWQGVQLSLAGGQPIAFIQDLYTPLYAQRPVVQMQHMSAMAPQNYDQGLAQTKPSGPGAQASAMAPPAPAPASRLMAKEAYMADEIAEDRRRELSGSGIQAAASSAQEGDTFFFNVNVPIDLARRQSAMIPLVSSELEGEELSIYNRNVNQKRPLLGVWLQGISSTRLPAGPLSVFSNAMYAGDSLLDTLGAAEKRLLSYGVDLDVSIQSNNRQDRLSTGYSIVKGVVYTKTAWKFSQIYTLKNNALKPRSILIEHPYNASRTLTAGQEFSEKTDALYRFKITVKAGEQKDFAVEEEQTMYESAALLSIKSSGFAVWTSSNLSPAVKAALKKAFDLKLELEQLGETITNNQKKQSEITQDQSRIRDNLDSVGRDSTQGKRYLQKLSDQETELEKLVKELDSSRSALAKAQKVYEEYLKNLNVE